VATGNVPRNSGKIWTMVSGICMQTKRHTDTHTDTLVTILRSRTGRRVESGAQLAIFVYGDPKHTTYFSSQPKTKRL